LVDFYQKKNNDKNRNKELIKENYAHDSDCGESLTLINDFLSALKYEKSLTDAAVRYNEDQLYPPVSYYGSEVFLQYLQDYFNHKGYGASMSDFLKMDKTDYRKLVYIEKKLADEKQFIEKFIVSLNNTYNERRNRAGNKSRTFSQTSLVINNAIKAQIIEALKSRSETDITHAFLTYCDQVIAGVINPHKFLPYFFSKQFGEYGVIDTYLEYFNLNYSMTR